MASICGLVGLMCGYVCWENGASPQNRQDTKAATTTTPVGQVAADPGRQRRDREDGAERQHGHQSAWSSGRGSGACRGTC